MLSAGDGVFVQLPGESNERVLHAAKIVATGEGTYTAEFEEDDLRFEPGMRVVLFFEDKGEFVQQRARIDVVLNASPAPMIGFETTGESRSAERRRGVRISTATSGLTACLGDEDACPLLDVGTRGFSVSARRRYEIGQAVGASLTHERVEYSGRVTIQSRRLLRDGRTRYGLKCSGREAPDTGLRAGLEVITEAAQRQQIRRLMGTG